MAQNAPHFCPRCGAPVMPGQRACANCGLDVSSRVDSADYSAPTQSYSPGTRFPAQGLSSPPAPPSSQVNQPMVPLMPASPNHQKKRLSGRVGCVIGLLVVGVLGVAAYFVAALLGVQIPGLSTVVSQPTVTAATINETVNYAGVDITILNAQQADRFINDPNTASNGMLRLNLKGQNNTNVPVSWLYTNSAHLILPGGTTLAPLYVKAKGGIAPGATQTSLVDFAVPTGTDVHKIILRLGTVSEAQMDVPLSGHANLSMYDPRTVKLNGQMSYMGLNWTLTQATSQLHTDGQQASRGMRYITVTLSVDNPLSQEEITGSPYTYMRLKSGNTLLSPVNSTLPVSFTSNETGKTGTVTFLAPQQNTAFTLLLQPQGTASGFNSDSTDFQIA